MFRWDEYQAALAKWDELHAALVQQPPQPDDLSRIETALPRLSRFRGASLLQTWAENCPAPIYALRAGDIDDDGQTEVVAITAKGEVLLFRQQADKSWSRMGTASLPQAPNGYAIGILLARSQYESGQKVLVLANGEVGPHLYELTFLPEEKGWRLAERTGRERALQPVIPIPYGDLGRLPTLQVTLPGLQENRGQYCTIKLLDDYGRGVTGPVECDCPDQVLAVAYDQSGIYVGGAGNYLRRLSYPKNGEPLSWDDSWRPHIDGTVQAMCLSHPPGGPDLVLVATEENEILAFSTKDSDCAWRFTAPDEVLAIDALPGQMGVVTGDRRGALQVYLVAETGEADQCSARIEEAYRLAVQAAGSEKQLLQRWLGQAEPALATFAMERVLSTWTDWGLDSLRDIVSDGMACIKRQSTVLPLLDRLENRLIGGTADSRELFALLRTYHERCRWPGRRRIALLLARYAAHVRSRPDDPNYDFLWERRREGDLDAARRLYQEASQETPEKDRLLASLSFCSELLTTHRQQGWPFAATTPITALKVLPRELQVPVAVVATSNGELAAIRLDRLDVETQKLSALDSRLEGDSVRAIGLQGGDGSVPPELVMATARGWLLVYRLEGELYLDRPNLVRQLGYRIWSPTLAGQSQAGGRPSWAMIGDGSVAYCSYDPAQDRWEVVPRRDKDVQGWVRTMAIRNTEQGQLEEIVLADAHDVLLHTWSFFHGDRRERRRFTSPVVGVRLIHLQTAANAAPVMAVACTDGQVYLFDQRGERRWHYHLDSAARSLEVLDVDQDGVPEILVGTSEGRLHVLDLRGEVCWSTPVGTAAVVCLTGVPDLPGRSCLLVGDTENTLYFFEVILPGGDTEQVIREETEAIFGSLVGDGDPVKYLEGLTSQECVAFSPYLLSYVAHALQWHRDWEVKEILPLLSLMAERGRETSREIQETVARTLVQAVGEAPVGEEQEKVRGLVVAWLKPGAVQPESQAFLLAEVVRRIGETNLPLWEPVLQAAAGHPAPKVRREVVRALAPFWCTPSFPAENHPAWSLLARAAQPLPAVEASGDDETWVQEEIAAIVRDRFHSDRASAFELAHHLIRRRVDPRWLLRLGDPENYMLLEEEARELFLHLGQLAVAGPEQMVDALVNLARSINQAVQENIWDPSAPLVLAYQGLARLASLSTLEQWQRYFLEPAQEQGCLESLLELGNGDSMLAGALARPLEEIRKVVLEGLNRARTDTHSRWLEQLRGLSSDLEALRPKLQPEKAQDGLQALWYRLLSAVLHRWASALLGQEIQRLSQTFLYEVQSQEVRFAGDQIRITFNLANTGYIYAYDVGLSRPRAEAAGRELACELEGEWLWPGPFVPGNRYVGTVLAQVERDLAESWARAGEALRIHLRLQMTYHVPPNQNEREISLIVPLPAERERVIDYPASFPKAFAHYSRQLRDLLEARPDLILVECEPGARYSFLEGVKRLVPRQRCQILDLREGCRAAARERVVLEEHNFAVQPHYLFLWLLKSLWEGIELPLLNDLQYSESDKQYQDAVYQAWKQMPEGLRPDILILDHLESVFARLLQNDEERMTVRSILPFLKEFARNAGVHIVLGGTYLTERMLDSLFPGLRPKVVRADYLRIGTTARSEADAFLQQEIAERRLGPVLHCFTTQPTTESLVDLAGGNLHVLRSLILEALEQADRDAADVSHGAARRELGNLTDYFLNYGRRTNFFSLLWVWLPFYAKIALTLVAHSEFSIEMKKWLASGLVLSRPYRPSLAPDSRTGRPRHSAKVVAEAEERLNAEIINKISSDRFFQADDLWVRGLCRKRASSLQESPAAQMLLRLLNAVGIDDILEQLTAEGLFSRLELPTPLDAAYHFPVPLLGAWFRSNGVMEHLTTAAQDKKGADWCPPALFLDQRQQKAKPPLFAGRTLQPFYLEVGLDDIPAIHTALQKEDLVFFLNLCGISGRALDPRARWLILVQLTRALDKCGQLENPIAQDLLLDLFAALGRLLQRKSAPCSPGKDVQPEQVPLKTGGLAWQCFDFEEILPGFWGHLLLGWTSDGGPLVPHEALLRQLAEKKLAPSGRREIEEQGAESRSVVVLFALRGAATLRQEMEQRFGAVRYAILDEKELAEIMVAADPARQLLRQVQTHIGRHPFSPYKLQGPLQPGSRLFVGREEEVERIRDGIDTKDFLILGSRRIGKTSLLHHIQAQLDPQHYLPIPISLLGEDRPGRFYARLRDFLRQNQEVQEYADALNSDGYPYDNLRDLVVRLRKETGKHPVFLLDEIDGLYRWDTEENQRRFFEFLRNELAQPAPRLCSFVMTGCQTILLARFSSQSVFFNYCEAMNISHVDEDSARRLVNLLFDYGIEFYHRDDALARILKRTYCIPWLIQAACDHLLEHLDKQHTGTAKQEDVEHVLSREVDLRLRRELFDDLLIEQPVGGLPASLAKLQMQLVMLCAVLGKYDFRIDQASSYRQLPKEERSFTAVDVVGYMDYLVDEVKEYWAWTETEVDTILRSLSITLALNIGDDGTSYYFPQAILPDVLFRQQYDSKTQMGLLDYLAKLIEQYEVLYRQNYPGAGR